MTHPLEKRKRENRFAVEARLVSIATATALCVFLAGIVIDTLMHVQNREILISDIFTSGTAGVLAYFAGRYYVRARKVATDRLQVAAEVNHHVRNALTAVLYSVHARRDTALMDVTQQAVSRIDWVLREVLGSADGDPRLEAPTVPSERRRPA